VKVENCNDVDAGHPGCVVEECDDGDGGGDGCDARETAPAAMKCKVQPNASCTTNSSGLSSCSCSILDGCCTSSYYETSGTWSDVYTAITNSSCSGCHSGALPSGGLDLSSSSIAKSALNNGVNCSSSGTCGTSVERTVDYDLAASAFHQKTDTLSSNQCGGEMSTYVTGWTTTERNLVRRWICSGTP
jgi:hypothetical protein